MKLKLLLLLLVFLWTFIIPAQLSKHDHHPKHDKKDHREKQEERRNNNNKPGRRRGKVEDVLAEYDDDNSDDDDEEKGEWLLELQDVRGSCSPNPCLNNGVCEEKRGRFKCKCPRPFKGRTCERSKKACKRDTCGYGQCVLTSSPPFFECKCIPPFKPPNCKRIAPCELNPCQNGASCMKDGQDFDCICRAGYSGKFCQVGPNDCYEGNGESYRGKVSETEDGKDCLFWNSHFLVHKGTNPFNSANDPQGLGPHNYCRNPDGESKPWCFIRSEKMIRWEHCEVKKCPTVATPLPVLPVPKPTTADHSAIHPQIRPTPPGHVPIRPTPGSGTPAIHTPEGGTVEILTPAIGTPAIHTPGSGTPDIHTPGSGTPDIHTPGSGTPDIHTPGSGAPDIHTPGSGTPDIHPTGSGTPAVHTPESGSPEIHTPGSGSPEIHTPGSATPGENTTGGVITGGHIPEVLPTGAPPVPAILPLKQEFATCGKPQPVKPIGRIYGGIKALPGGQPWQASLQDRPKGTNLPFRHVCGGTLIKACWVLTAGHCIEKAKDFQVVLGSTNLAKTESSQQKFAVVQTIIHEQYRETPESVYNDIALLRLKDKNGRCAEESQFVKVACLPSQDFPQGTVCSISGWGATPDSQHGSNQLLDADVLLIAQETCSSAVVYGKYIDNTMVCAGYLEGGVDSCQGDSGGPLTCVENQNHYIYGIVSWGDNCGQKNKPGVYTRVTHFVDWINRSIAGAGV